jgi:DNA helicase IV
MACRYLEADKFIHPFKHILVDEFQDISQDRFRLLRAMLNQNKETKLFSVGDDWQSIYRFAGSDVQIMANFRDKFRNCSISFLNHTFRSYQGIVEVASEFIQENPDQIKKEVVSDKRLDGNQVLIEGYNNKSDQEKKLESTLEKLNKTGADNNVVVTVFLLARYNHQLPTVSTYQQRFLFLDLKAMSIHASKGLEADYVILLSLESGSYGFPSRISSDPLLDMVTPVPEDFEHAEERRLMYVSITRAKRATILFASTVYRSSFVNELSRYESVTCRQSFTKGEQCPECKVGNLKKKKGKHGDFLGCSEYPTCAYTQNSDGTHGLKTNLGHTGFKRKR